MIGLNCVGRGSDATFFRQRTTGPGHGFSSVHRAGGVLRYVQSGFQEERGRCALPTACGVKVDRSAVNQANYIQMARRHK